MKTHNTEEIVSLKFIELFSKLEFKNMLDLLHANVVSHITNFQGGVDVITGPHDYLSRLNTMDVRNVELSIMPTQIVTVKPGLIMVMVEINASKGDKVLHNFATHLLKFKGNKIKELWMVEALPLGSSEFWA